VKERRNGRGKGRRNVKRKERGENEGYLPSRRIIYVVSLRYLGEGLLHYEVVRTLFVVRFMYFSCVFSCRKW
jgi:hypothetical protein